MSDVDWPPSNVSKIRLLGLFQDNFNSSDPRSGSDQFLALFKAAVILSQRYNITVDGQFIGWHIEQTAGKVIDSLRSTCLAVLKSHVVGIVGPRLSREAHTIAAFAEIIGIPVVSYTATDPDLSSRNALSCFLSHYSAGYLSCISYRRAVHAIQLGHRA